MREYFSYLKPTMRRTIP